VIARSPVLRLTDIVETIERIHGVLGDISLETFESDWQRQWLVERGVEIISEASRHLAEELKSAIQKFHGKRWPASEMSYVTTTKTSRRRLCGGWPMPTYQHWAKSAARS
jgi:hypothetical protein